MTWTLVTNDDGIDSPALVPLVRGLQAITEVRVVVPDRERSWVGKAITRHDPVTVHEVKRAGIAMRMTSGYPADCVQLGIAGLFTDPPSLVVSGINIGYNHGAGYIQSSGTVGAAVEALLGGVPAVALSAGSSSRPWTEWKRWVYEPEAVEMWTRLATVSTDIIGRLMAHEPPGSVVNVNLPDDADHATPRRITAVASVGYDRLFRREADGRYVHDYGGGLRHFAELRGTDVETSAERLIAITPVDPMGTGAFSTSLAADLAANQEKGPTPGQPVPPHYGAR
jgi:5'-nucleotidase